MILLDTTVIIDCFTGPRRSAPALREAIRRGERVGIPALALYEWLRGPRTTQELAEQEELLPREMALPFGSTEAAVAAELYRKLRRPRGREVDLAIAASAIAWEAELWTLNSADFRDIAGLRVSAPA